MTWIFNARPISEDDIPSNAVGFIYVIHLPDGRRYLGKKLLTKAAYKQVNGKRKKCRKPSDWENYWSSSQDLLALVDAGTDGYTREIIMFCQNKTLLNYAETTLQHRLKVLETDDWLNRNISMKFFKRNIQGKPELHQINSIVEKFI